MTDLSDALVNTMAATLANGCSFSDTLMVTEIAGDDSLDDLRCKLKRAHFSRRRPSYERPTQISSACIVARNVSETYLDFRHKKRGQIGKGDADAFCEQINEICSTALASQIYHNDRYASQPDTHLVEFANITPGTMDYVQCIALARPEPRVAEWGNRIGVNFVRRLCEQYVVGDQGKPYCAKYHRAWPCGKWTTGHADVEMEPQEREYLVVRESRIQRTSRSVKTRPPREGILPRERLPAAATSAETTLYANVAHARGKSAHRTHPHA